MTTEHVPMCGNCCWRISRNSLLSTCTLPAGKPATADYLWPTVTDRDWCENHRPEVHGDEAAT